LGSETISLSLGVVVTSTPLSSRITWFDISIPASLAMISFNLENLPCYLNPFLLVFNSEYFISLEEST
jgi:hypothetical protein